MQFYQCMIYWAIFNISISILFAIVGIIRNCNDRSSCDSVLVIFASLISVYSSLNTALFFASPDRQLVNQVWSIREWIIFCLYLSAGCFTTLPLIMRPWLCFDHMGGNVYFFYCLPKQGIDSFAFLMLGWAQWHYKPISVQQSLEPNEI